MLVACLALRDWCHTGCGGGSSWRDPGITFIIIILDYLTTMFGRQNEKLGGHNRQEKAALD
jgi:hypothetical protein